MIAICGLPFSGKTTTLEIIEAIKPKLKVSVEEIQNPETLVQFLSKTEEKGMILLVDTPVLLCYNRAPSSTFDYFMDKYNYEKYQKFINYVTQLPMCSIAKNDQSIDHLRFQIKNIIAKSVGVNR